MNDLQSAKKSLATTARENRNRKHASNACFYCRDKKRRCVPEGNGSGNCQPCASEGIQCIRDISKDQRRHQNRHLKRNSEALLHGLLGAIRSGSETDINVLVDVIKRDRSTAEIEAILHQMSFSGLSPTSLASPTRDMQIGTGIVTTHSGNPRWTRSLIDMKETSLPNGSKIRGSSSVDPINIEQEQSDYIKPDTVQSSESFTSNSAIPTNGYPKKVPERDPGTFKLPTEVCHPLIIGSDPNPDHLSQVMVSFRAAARAQILAGASVENILSLNGIELDLFFRARRPDDPHTVCTWACEFTKSFPFVSRVVQLAGVVFCASFMRWFILPCPETYAQVSSMLRPLCDRLIRSHTPDIDISPLTLTQRTQLFNSGCRTNFVNEESRRLLWPYSFDDCIEHVQLQPGSKPVLRITTKFMEHGGCPRNWTAHHDVLSSFPDLRGLTNFLSSGDEINDPG